MPVVAIDVGPLHGQRTGVGTAVEHTVDALRAIGNPPELIPYVVSFRAELAAGVRRLTLPASLAHRWWSHASRPHVDGALGHPDLIHGTNYVVPPSKCPRLVSIYDCWFLQHPDGVHGDVARAANVLRRNVADGAVVHVSSHATAHQVVELLAPRRVEVIALGTVAVDPPSAGQLPPIPHLAGKRFILSLGTLEQRKNVPTLIRAFADVHGHDPDIDLVIAGSEGNDAAAIVEAMGVLGNDAASKVSFTGRITESAKSWLLHHALVLAYPSLDEGFGFPILEAMQAGVPVVASTAGSIPEVAGDAAVLVDPADACALAAAIISVLDDPDARQRMIVAGKVRADQFDWHTTATRLSALYESMIEETP